MKNMDSKKGFQCSWQFKRGLIDILKEGFLKNNAPATMLAKASKFFKENPDNLKGAEWETLYISRYNELLRSQRCFHILKSGYIQLDKSECFMKLSSVSDFSKYQDGKCRVIDSYGKTHIISEENYLDLKLILS